MINRWKCRIIFKDTYTLDDEFIRLERIEYNNIISILNHPEFELWFEILCSSALFHTAKTHTHTHQDGLV